MNLKSLLTLTLLLTSSSLWAVNHTGSVMETMSAGGYTYAKVMQNEKEFWIAGPTEKVEIGDIISFDEQMKMANFTSKSLNRTFASLMFVGRITQGSSNARSAEPAFSHPAAPKPKNSAPVVKMSKAVGGYTVAELFSRKDELSNKIIKVHGQVVKISKQIMKKDWVHLQDGTGSAGTNDIIFLTKASTVKVGDMVLASGKLIVDRNFGAGYRYEVIVENSSFEVDK